MLNYIHHVAVGEATALLVFVQLQTTVAVVRATMACQVVSMAATVDAWQQSSVSPHSQFSVHRPIALAFVLKLVSCIKVEDAPVATFGLAAEKPTFRLFLLILYTTLLLL